METHQHLWSHPKPSKILGQKFHAAKKGSKAPFKCPKSCWNLGLQAGLINSSWRIPRCGMKWQKHVAVTLWQTNSSLWKDPPYFSWVNPLFQWPFSIALCMFTRPGISEQRLFPCWWFSWESTADPMTCLDFTGALKHQKAAWFLSLTLIWKWANSGFLFCHEKHQLLNIHKIHHTSDISLVGKDIWKKNGTEVLLLLCFWSLWISGQVASLSVFLNGDFRSRLWGLGLQWEARLAWWRWISKWSWFTKTSKDLNPFGLAAMAMAQ